MPVRDDVLAGRVSRRDFLAWSTRAAGLVALGALPARGDEPAWRAAAYPFPLGVASGDPSPDGFVLWTRLGPDPLNGGGMPGRPVKSGWEVARDDGFRQVVKRGEALALPHLAHSVHVEVGGLDPARDYWYRFTAGGERSAVGRARTAPRLGALPQRIALGVVSCQNYQGGFYTAYRHIVEEELDAVLHLGDYIYETEPQPDAPRQHEGYVPVRLPEYRSRHAQYKLDPDLQAAHARFPFIATWDDHDVDNDYAGVVSQSDDPVGEFLARRAAAYQAYYEHMPLRRTSMPKGPYARIYRRVAYGGLADLFVLDTRQYRTDQPCGGGGPRCPEAMDPRATMLGAEQERWLLAGLERSSGRWKVIGNQVPFAQIANRSGSEAAFSMDKWDGYVGARRRVVDLLRRRPVNPVFLTGDMHVNIAADLLADFDDPASPIVGSEFVGTSLSSGGDGRDLPLRAGGMLAANPHVRFMNGQRGYLRCTATSECWTTDFRVVPYVSRRGAPVETRASFAIEHGRPGMVRA